MNSQKVLTHLVRAGRDALHIENILNGIGYKETPYFNLYGEIADAIYTMLGENVDSFDESVTHSTINDPLTSDELAAEQLAKLLNKTSGAIIQINNTTRDIIAEAANSRGVDFEKMANIILSEWAVKHILQQKLMA